MIQADPQRVEQAIVNLLTNAIKYGEGKPVDVVVSAQGAFATVSVIDRGPGIAAADQELIFHRYERLKSGEARVPGLGLGLYIARRIAEAHGGDLTLASAPGEGAKFTLRLPRLSERDALSSSRNRAQPAPRRSAERGA
jgi:signal transduction histidine kinase